MDVPAAVRFWRRLFQKAPNGWVLFRHGTLIAAEGGEADADAALDIIRQYGPVRPGSPNGDFSVYVMKGRRGWLVTCNHPRLLKHVGREVLDQTNWQGVRIGTFRGEQRRWQVGLVGRDIRHRDSLAPEIVHVERR